MGPASLFQLIESPCLTWEEKQSPLYLECSSFKSSRFPLPCPKQRSNLTSFRERRIRPAYKGHFLEPCPFPHPPYRPGPVSESGTQGRHASSTLQYCSSTQEPLLYTGGSQSRNLLLYPSSLVQA